MMSYRYPLTYLGGHLGILNNAFLHGHNCKLSHESVGIWLLFLAGLNFARTQHPTSHCQWKTASTNAPTPISFAAPKSGGQTQTGLTECRENKLRRKGVCRDRQQFCPTQENGQKGGSYHIIARESALLFSRF